MPPWNVQGKILRFVFIANMYNVYVVERGVWVVGWVGGWMDGWMDGWISIWVQGLSALMHLGLG